MWSPQPRRSCFVSKLPATMIRATITSTTLICPLPLFFSKPVLLIISVGAHFHEQSYLIFPIIKFLYGSDREF